MRYDIELLKQFVNDNEINLLGEYTYVNSKTKIKGSCSTLNCNNIFEKQFRPLYANRLLLCDSCTEKNKQEKIKKTNKVKYGVECSLNNKDVQDKIKKTLVAKFGVEHPAQNNDIKKQMQQTTFKRLGVINPGQSEIVKDKMKATNLERFGVEHSSQNSEIAEKTFKNAVKSKLYIFPSGKQIKLQGYEPFGIDYLLNIDKINENDIITDRKHVPEIWYFDITGKKHRYFVDIFIPSLNKCIEIKSEWTIKKEKDNVYIKQKAMKDAGYECEIWLFHSNGKRLNVIP